MPVRSLTQSVLRWPDPEQLLDAVRQWAQQQAQGCPSLQQVSAFSSDGRGEATVGSDLDLLIVDRAVTGLQWQRLQRWPLEQLPLSCDALVLTPEEFERLLGSDQRMATALQSDLRWLWTRSANQLQ